TSACPRSHKFFSSDLFYTVRAGMTECCRAADSYWGHLAPDRSCGLAKYKRRSSLGADLAIGSASVLSELSASASWPASPNLAPSLEIERRLACLISQKAILMIN